MDHKSFNIKHFIAYQIYSKYGKSESKFYPHHADIKKYFNQEKVWILFLSFFIE